MHKLLHWEDERMRMCTYLPTHKIGSAESLERLIHFIHGVLNPFHVYLNFGHQRNPVTSKRFKFLQIFSYHIYRPSSTGLPHS